MATQSGIFAFDEGRATLTQGADGVWLGETRRPTLSRLPSGLAATSDGRIDNRDELLPRLGSPSSDSADDANLAVALFGRWGADRLRWMIGDWRLAVWDPAGRTVQLARDYRGARPLYYCVDSRYAAWSSDLAGLVKRAGRAADLSDRFAAGFMSLRLSPYITPYEGVHPGPPGVCGSISAARRVTPRRFWTPQARAIPYPPPPPSPAPLPPF